MTEYAHFSEVPTANWRWGSFSPREIACKGTGKVLVNEDALDKLQALRDRLRKPLILTSAYRSPEHNRRIGGAKNSQHMQGIAFDVRMDNHDPHEFEAAARAVGFTGFGYYPKSGFMHIDTGRARTWGTPWPLSATTWPSEPPRQAESVREDREVQAVAGASVAGAVAIGAEHLPLASGLLGSLAPHAQLVAVVIGAILIGYFLWKRSR
jgi:zinc D-Ala-D-Ala carboxypeptidase